MQGLHFQGYFFPFPCPVHHGILSTHRFAGLAPHLAPYTDRIKEVTCELLAMEKAAVANRNFQGTDASDYPSLERLKPEKKNSPPYNREIKQFLEGTPWIAELNRD